jgi:hypothetical protein
MRFCELLKTTSPVYNVEGFPTTLFPAEMSDTQQYAHGSEMIEQISEHFFEYNITIAPPWYWVRRFHSVIRRHLWQWEKLIESEQRLRDDDAIYNYDLNESGTYENTGSGQADSYVSDTPDGSIQPSDIETYMSNAGRNKNETEGSGEHTLRRYGNIGVMTSAQIMGGYREAVDYDAYRVIFAELEPLFLGVFEEFAEVGSYDLKVNPVKDWGE